MEFEGLKLSPPESLIYGLITAEGKLSLGHLIHMSRSHMPCHEVKASIQSLIDAGLVVLTDDIDYTDGDRALSVCHKIVIPAKH